MLIEWMAETSVNGTGNIMCLRSLSSKVLRVGFVKYQIASSGTSQDLLVIYVHKGFLYFLHTMTKIKAR